MFYSGKKKVPVIYFLIYFNYNLFQMFFFLSFSNLWRVTVGKRKEVISLFYLTRR